VGHNELVNKGALSLVLKSLGTILGLVLTIFITRILGAEKAGIYFLVVAIVTAFSVAVRLGLDYVVTRSIAAALAESDWKFVNKFYMGVVLLITTVAIVLCGILFFASNLVGDVFNNKDVESVWRYMLWAIIPVSLYSIHGHFFQGMKDIKWYIFSRGVGIQLFLVLFIIVFIFCFDVNLSAVTLGILYVTSACGALFVLLSVWWRNPLSIVSKPCVERKYMVSAKSLWGEQMINQSLLWAPPIMLGLYASNVDVSIFSVANRTANVISFILLAVNSIAAPKYAAYYHLNNMQELKSMAIFSVRLMLLISFPLTLALVLFPASVMSLFGSEFVQGEAVLIVLVLGQFVNVASGSVSSLLSMTGHGRELFSTTFFAAAIMVGLCFFLIPRHGLMGAAIAQFSSVICSMLIGNWLVNKRLGFFPMNIFEKI
jgi:O-antigen/teichoic acid export membrane protein